MTKNFNLLQLFSLVDGRLSTNMEDVYSMINHITDDDLMTHQLSIAFKYIKNKNPKWFIDVKKIYDELGINKNTDFLQCIDILTKNNKDIAIPQLKDEHDVNDLLDFMIKNSLLI